MRKYLCDHCGGDITAESHYQGKVEYTDVERTFRRPSFVHACRTCGHLALRDALGAKIADWMTGKRHHGQGMVITISESGTY